MPGEKAKGAEANFTLKDDIDLTDKMSLDGKAVTIDHGGKNTSICSTQRKLHL